MILDTGICTVYHTVDTAGPGEKPNLVDAPLFQSWYGELSFETAPARPTPDREEIRTDARIRILQCRRVTNHDCVDLTDAEGSTTRYRVTRAFHGTDAESGELITDLNLEVIAP